MSVCGCQAELIVGDVSMTARDTAPTGWLMLTGPNKAGWVEKSAYPELYTAIGDKFNNNDAVGGSGRPSANHFYVGIDEGLFPMTQYDSAGSGTEITGDAGEKTGGADTVTLTLSNLPSDQLGVTGALTSGAVAGSITGLSLSGMSVSGSGTVETASSHTHTPGTPTRSFVTVEPPFSKKQVVDVDPDNATRYTATTSGGSPTSSIDISSARQIEVNDSDLSQQNNASTGGAGTKNTNISDIAAGLTVTGSVSGGSLSGASVSNTAMTGITDELGDDTPFSVVSSHFRINYKIKAR